MTRPVSFPWFRPALALALGAALVGGLAGCGAKEKPDAPAAAPVPHDHQPLKPSPRSSATPKSGRHTPAATAATSAHPSLSAAKTVLPPVNLDQAVSRYQALANQPEERSSLVSEIALSSGDQAAPADVARTLGKLLGIESDEEIKTEILSELGSLETPVALAPILAAARADQPAKVQQAAVDAADELLSDLGSSEEAAAFDPIVSATNAHLPKAIRLSAIDALEFLEDKRALPILQKLKKDADEEVREAATDALSSLQDD